MQPTNDTPTDMPLAALPDSHGDGAVEMQSIFSWPSLGAQGNSNKDVNNWQNKMTINIT